MTTPWRDGRDGGHAAICLPVGRLCEGPGRSPRCDRPRSRRGRQREGQVSRPPDRQELYGRPRRPIRRTPPTGPVECGQATASMRWGRLSRTRRFRPGPAMLGWLAFDVHLDSAEQPSLSSTRHHALARPRHYTADGETPSTGSPCANCVSNASRVDRSSPRCAMLSASAAATLGSSSACTL